MLNYYSTPDGKNLQYSLKCQNNASFDGLKNMQLRQFDIDIFLTEFGDGLQGASDLYGGSRFRVFALPSDFKAGTALRNVGAQKNVMIDRAEFFLHVGSRKDDFPPQIGFRVCGNFHHLFRSVRPGQIQGFAAGRKRDEKKKV